MKLLKLSIAQGIVSPCPVSTCISSFLQLAAQLDLKPSGSPNRLRLGSIGLQLRRGMAAKRKAFVKTRQSAYPNKADF
ncbi:hypothetical protein NT2_02_02690 [Caenibius tardaugens NBRC 16725]|uniref:Uncharacterized protein n=1 Tax=Caenibius tardaugens NBRC 16725 TaxID=1219035 RepID=U2YJ35_9SPHN|nr:hypothetical protein NT2_02_02690 [Caenibius tardaugens NBRC 16725]